VELGGSETNERMVPSILQEAYELRDASAVSEEWDYYQKHVYRLRGEEYRSRGIRFEESARRRERSRAKAFQAGGGKLSPGGSGYSGGGNEERDLRASLRAMDVSGGDGEALLLCFYGYGR
jgi:hypothetical protein